MYSDSADFSGQIIRCDDSNGDFTDAFLAKYDTDGNLLWIKTGGSDYSEVAWGLAIDNGGRVFMTGEFNAYSIFDGLSLSSNWSADIFVACYDANGTIQWLKKAGGPLLDRARGIGTDGTNAYITGQFGGTASFDSHTITAVDSSDIFIAAINSSGDFSWALAVGGIADAYEELSYESGNAVCSHLGYVYATGALLDGGTFGASPLTKYGRTDAFITRISQVGANVPEVANAGKINVYPNPGTGILMLDTKNLTSKSNSVCVYNCLGQCVMSSPLSAQTLVNINLLAEEKGIYFIEVKSEDHQTIARERIVIQ